VTQPPNSRPTDLDRELQGFFDFLIAVADDGLSWPKLIPEEREALEAARIALRIYSQKMLRWLNGDAHSKLSDPLKHEIRHALRMTFEVGMFANVSESAKKYAGEMRAIAMCASKAKDDAEKESKLDQAILACVRGDRSKLNSYRDATTPRREEVLGKLEIAKEKSGTKPVWPSASTVRARIMALKKS
jgi:hypothetical protein